MRRPLLHVAALLSIGISTACAKTGAEWRGELEHSDPFVRGVAAIGLSLSAPREAAAAVPVLLKTIDRKDVGLDEEAARALVGIGEFHVPLLLAELAASDVVSDDRRNALKVALVAGGPRATPAIVQCMRGPGLQRSADLGDVLLEIGAPSVAPVAEMLLEEEDVRLRKFAAFLLARLGPVARDALPALRAVAAAPDPELRSVAEQAIASILSPAGRTH